MSSEQIPSVSLLAYHGKLDDVKDMILADPNLATIKDCAGWIPLHWACAGGHIELVIFLLEKGGHLDEKNNAGKTPLMIASNTGQTDVVRHLLQCGGDPKAQSSTNETALHYASAKGHMDIARLLLENGVDINAQDHLGTTPLHLASAKGHVKMVGYLLTFPQIQVNLADFNGRTALQLALENVVG